VANKITITRILIIPMFVGALLYYQEAGEQKAGSGEQFRWTALLLFVAASLTDALDGWVARRFNQRSRLGSILDPLADKGLILSAVLTLAWLDHPELYRLPIWFVVLVLSRDVLLVAGVATLHFYGQEVRVLPHWSGKMATFLMMASLSCILFRCPQDVAHGLVVTCGIFIFLSTAVYMIRGIRLVNYFNRTEGEQ